MESQVGVRIQQLNAPVDDARRRKERRNLTNVLWRKFREEDGGLYASVFGEEVEGRAQ